MADVPHRVSVENARAMIASGQASWWDEDRRLVLLSPALMAETPDGTVLRAIDGEVVTKGKDDLDGDVRCGVLTYGFDVGEEVGI